MKTLYTDASFDYRHTDETTEHLVRGKIAVSGEGLSLIDKVAIGKVPELRQYINILELVAIARAIELASTKEWQDAELKIITDSQVAKGWASKGKISPKVVTAAHTNALEYLAKAKKLFGGTINFFFTPRDNNPAGHLLAVELEKSKPHDI
ncbi:MAG: hypothetical protein WD898_02385 [Candidatus Paceibacterota bacterium]